MVSNDINLSYIRGELTIGEYTEKVIDGILFSEASRGCMGLENKAKEIIRFGFKNIDSVERSHPIWKNSNNLPTISKINEYSELMVNKGNTNINYRWLLIFLHLFCYGPDHLVFDWWQYLHKKNEMNIVWLIKTAWNTSHYWWDHLNIEKLATIIAKLNLIEESLPVLSSIGKDKSNSIINPYDWCQMVKFKCSEKFL